MGTLVQETEGWAVARRVGWMHGWRAEGKGVMEKENAQKYRKPAPLGMGRTMPNVYKTESDDKAGCVDGGCRASGA